VKGGKGKYLLDFTPGWWYIPHLVILGDPHLPGKNVTEKEKVIKTINSWEDVDILLHWRNDRDPAGDHGHL